jgi:hypothetical protein
MDCTASIEMDSGLISGSVVGRGGDAFSKRATRSLTDTAPTVAVAEEIPVCLMVAVAEEIPVCLMVAVAEEIPVCLMVAAEEIPVCLVDEGSILLDDIGYYITSFLFNQLRIFLIMNPVDT